MTAESNFADLVHRRVGAFARKLTRASVMVLVVVLGALSVPGTAHALGNNYPWPHASMSQHSPLRFVYRNCTDYAAWTLNKQLGGSTTDIRFDWSSIQAGGSGHARDWRQGALNRGKPVDGTPKRGAVAWWGSSHGGGYGHVAIVADVRDGGNTIEVHEYNHGYTGAFNARPITRSGDWPQDFLHIADLPDTPAPAPPSDADADGVPDSTDRCPRMPGPVNNRGCPLTGHTVTGYFHGNDDRLDVLSIYDYGNDSIGAWVFPGTDTGVAGATHLWRSPDHTWNWSNSVFLAGDFTGDDPHTDVIGFYDYGNDDMGAWLFRGTGNGLERERLLWRSGVGQWNMRNGSTFLVGDFTGGDDRDDVVALYDYGNDDLGAWVFTGNGDGVNRERILWRTGAGQWALSRSSFVAGEFTGTAGTDLVAFYDYGNDDLGAWVFSGTGDGIAPGAFRWRTGPGQWRHQSSRYLAGDFGDDGFTDVVALYDYGNDDLGQWTFTGNGDGVAPGAFRWRTGPGQWNPGNSKWALTGSRNSRTSDVTAFYNYGGDNLGGWQLPGTLGGLDARRLLWTTGPGKWNWTAM
ncbi:Choline binding protein D [Alloactinosynnema sp. L-07]|uniref:CHAP domain-containing protein n=1 Tax=Alloactinosynnema sp. L-07 TaxID=1653480 RepID=UPI00065EF50E|nr:CHAP domain-containing protein [Alloactinosynnema sp. L-07]CRK59332.1 Choline binding protein D [Alloactinosynnema sp. L-07]